MLEFERESPPEDFLIPYLGEFVERRFQELEELKVSNESHDFPSVKKIAHNWAGVCKPYGFEALAKIARDIERMAEERNAPEISQTASEIETYLEKKKTALKLN